MKKVKSTKSLRSKLFILVSTLVLMTVVVNTTQTSFKFKDYLENDVRESLIANSERTASLVEKTILSYKNQVFITMQNILRSPPKSRNQQMLGVINGSQNEIIAYHIVRKMGKDGSIKSENYQSITKSNDPRFEDVKVTNVIKSIKATSLNWIKKVKSKKSSKTNDLFLKNISSEKGIKLPIMNVGVSFPLEGSNDTIYAILSVWQTELINSLGKGQSESGLILDSKGNIFTSPKSSLMTKSNSKSNPSIFQAAAKSRVRSGFKSGYKNTEGKDVFGAYTLLNKAGDLILVFERDAGKAQAHIIKTIITSLAWSVFLVLLALFVGYFSAEGITKSLMELTGITRKIANGDFTHTAPIRSEDEVGILGNSINQMSIQIQHLMKATAEKVRLEQELETAKVVQTTFFPKKDISVGPFKVSGYYQPASECGGDLWGHFTIREGVELVFIADAMGHGAPAALVTAMAYSTCMTIADLVKSNVFSHSSPSELLARMNRVIHQAVDGSISMTCFIAILDFNEGKICFSNAGHNFPILIPATEDDARAKRVPKSFKKISPLSPISLSLKGVPLGIEGDSEYKDKEMDLKAGDKLFLFTDGLIECESPTNKVWTRKKLTEKILRHADKSHIVLKDRIVSSAFKFFSTEPLKDDVTIVVAEVDKEWTASSTAPTQNKEDTVKAKSNASLPEIALPESANNPAGIEINLPDAPVASITPPLPVPLTNMPNDEKIESNQEIHSIALPPETEASEEKKENEAPEISGFDLNLPGEESAPEVPLPDLSSAEVSLPDISAPEVSLPDVSESEVSLSDISAPEVSLPDVSVPEVSLHEDSTKKGDKAESDSKDKDDDMPKSSEFVLDLSSSISAPKGILASGNKKPGPGVLSTNKSINPENPFSKDTLPPIPGSKNDIELTDEDEEIAEKMKPTG